MAIKDAVTTVLNRNAFYRDGYRLLVKINLILGAVIVLLSVAVISLVLSIDAQYVYFATTADGRIINIVPLNEPFRTRAQVVAWAARSAQEVMRFNYSDYRQRLQQASVNFTPSGWESFTRALQDSRVLQAVEARKLLVSMVIESAPEVKREYVDEGVYTWEIFFPMEIRFEGDQAPQAIKAKLFMKIVRVSNLQNPQGISIEQWVAN